MMIPMMILLYVSCVVNYTPIVDQVRSGFSAVLAKAGPMSPVQMAVLNICVQIVIQTTQNEDW